MSDIEVKRATPEETAAWLVAEYDRLVTETNFSRPSHPKWGQMANIAARLADFVAAQYVIRS